MGKPSGLWQAIVRFCSDKESVSSPHARFHEASQQQERCYSDLTFTKITEILKSSSLENASTQSLISVINVVLDINIETKREEISDKMAPTLRNIMLEIERRISSQDEHIKIQNNLFKSSEEKYQSKIKILETHMYGMNQEAQREKFKSEELEKIEKEIARLMKQKEENDQRIAKLEEELECTNMAHKHKYQQIEHKLTESRNKLKEKDKELNEKKKELDDMQRKLNFLLAESEKMRKELYILSEWNTQNMNKKNKCQDMFSSQSDVLMDLRLALDSIKNDIINAQRAWQKDCSDLGKPFRKMARTSQMYHEVLVENRRIYNELQEMKGNIRVYCRIRPFTSNEDRNTSTVRFTDEDGELILVNPSKQGKDGNRIFKFNKVYGPMASQEEVYLDTQPLIRSVLDGYNVCIFAYGQTGSGKTYTMSGPSSPSKETWGVNYRALNDLFHLSKAREGTTLYEIDVQMLEIYNEQVRDLLSSDGSQKKLEIRNSSHPNGVVVPDASIHSVISTSDVQELMQYGEANRIMSATAINERSSRSHSVLTVHVRGMDVQSGAYLRGCLHLIDLAGSERIDRSEVTGDRLKEAQHINRSLSALGDVVSALSQKSSHVPYRNSKLTQLLQNSLGGRAKTLMFIQLNPDVQSYSETLSTLKFAERTLGVELGAARSNKESKDVKDLMDQVTSLRDAITRRDDEIEQFYILNESKNQSVFDANGQLEGNDHLNHLSSSMSTPNLSNHQQIPLAQRTKEPPAHSRKHGVEKSRISDTVERNTLVKCIPKEGQALKSERDFLTTHDPNEASDKQRTKHQLHVPGTFLQRSKSTSNQLRQESNKVPLSPSRMTSNQVGQSFRKNF